MIQIKRGLMSNWSNEDLAYGQLGIYYSDSYTSLYVGNDQDTPQLVGADPEIYRSNGIYFGDSSAPRIDYDSSSDTVTVHGNITGIAARAAQDMNGETISSTYARLSQIVDEVAIQAYDPDDSEVKLWVDTSSGSTNVTTDADTLNGYDGSFYTNMNNASGVLPVSNGGTGVTSISALKQALGVPNISYGTSNPSGGQDGDIYFQYFD